MESINIFPDTGHHYHFIEVPSDFQKQSPQLRQLWNRLRMNGWKLVKDYPWVRYRYDVHQPEGHAEQMGVWLAIESNLGSRTRGMVYDPRRPILEKPVTEIGDYDESKTPYAYLSEGYIPEDHVVRLSLELPTNLRKANSNGTVEEECVKIPIPIAIVWQKSAAEKPIDVDLIIDFGNTRTAAMLLENDPTLPFNQVCSPLRFVPRGTPYPAMKTLTPSDDPYSVVDSWIVLNETVFSGLEPPAEGFNPVIHYEVKNQKTKPTFFGPTKEVRIAVAETRLLPQMFMELSPVVMGGGNAPGCARQILRTANLDDSPNFFLSSPKRYVWDADPVGREGKQFWHVQLNPWNPLLGDPLKPGLPRLKPGLPQLQGPILMFMDPDGRYWNLDEKPSPNERAEFAHRPHADDKPTHPRRDALVWSALSILETAFRQISSPEYRKARKPYVRRRLRSVAVTYPSGWTAEEIESYRQQWQKAINIFVIGHLRDRRPIADGGDRPELVIDLDEAVAAQLPIIFSQIQLMPGGESWIELMGRGEGINATVRVMNLDIGGGTTDVAVVEYRDKALGSQVNIQADLLFKNSNNCAGDQAVKQIIESVLLPCMANSLPLDPAMRAGFEQLFLNRGALLQRDPTIPVKMARIVRLVFWPIVISWMRELSENRYGDPATGGPFAPNAILDANGLPVVDPTILDELNQLGEMVTGIEKILPEDVPLAYDQRRVKAAVSDVFDPLFRSLAKLVSGFDCDLVLVSGKSSELPQIKELLHRHMPVALERLLFAHHFAAGDWYPFGDNGIIGDAKTATVVGAALARAIRRNGVSGWQLTMEQKLTLTDDNYWGPMGELFDESVFLRPGENRATFKASTNLPIGRKRLLSPDVNADQVYKLRWKPHRDRHLTADLTVTMERRKTPGCGETLKLIEVSGTDLNGKPVTLDDVELQLCTLSDGEFWMDNPSFIIHWD